MDNKREKWDMGLDYMKTFKMFLDEFKNIKNKEILYKKDLKKYAYLIIFLIQIKNGCRVGEAVDGVLWFYENRNKINWNDTVVGWAKIEKLKKEEYRKITLPRAITKRDLERIEPILKELKNVKKPSIRLSNWLKRHYGINTHSLRYAFITYHAEMNTPAQIIAKMTGHKNLNYIVHYTQQRVADKMLLNTPEPEE
ncbi:integrase [Methanothermococcus sp. SCGC AD-155-C09]|nr:integrase [Methanothermococcus sp. SCGC AD-155-C09]